MACRLEPWEVEWEEKQKNLREYGMDITDASLLTRLLCKACEYLVATNGNHTIDYIIHEDDKDLAKWYEIHQQRDAEKEGK